MTKEKYKEALNGAFNQFITPTEQQTNETTPKAGMIAQPGMYETPGSEQIPHNPRYGKVPAYKAEMDIRNPRGRRVQLLFRQNVHADLKAIAEAQGRSFNNLVESILIDYLNKRTAGK